MARPFRQRHRRRGIALGRQKAQPQPFTAPTGSSLPPGWSPPPDLVAELARLSAPRPVDVCGLCGGDLIRTERLYGTCGHCGDRHKGNAR